MTRTFVGVAFTTVLAAMLPAAGPDVGRPFDAELPHSPYVARGGVSPRVLVVGDSWAEYMWSHRSLGDAFAANGHPEWTEKGDVTAIGGSTADEWAGPGMLALITSELASNPSIDIVHVSIGGNDFLAGQIAGGWHTGLNPAQESALVASVIDDIAAVAEHCLAQRPDVRVLLTIYDYPNFEETATNPLSMCGLLNLNLGNPTPMQVNVALAGLDAEVAAYAAATSRVDFVSVLGLMQETFGYPSMSIAPGTITRPGNVNLPSPPQALNGGTDCIHLNEAGYAAMAALCYDEFYSWALAPAGVASEVWTMYDLEPTGMETAP